jgi:hypothetical protein
LSSIVTVPASRSGFNLNVIVTNVEAVVCDAPDAGPLRSKS